MPSPPPPAPNVLPGEGTSLSYCTLTDGAIPDSPTWNPIAHRVTISGPDIDVKDVEKTTLDSTFHEYRPSQLPEPGSLSCTIYYDQSNTEHAALLAFVLPQTTQGANVVGWQLQFAPPVGATSGTSGGTLTAIGFINKFALKGFEIDTNVAADMTVKLTGPVVPGT